MNDVPDFSKFYRPVQAPLPAQPEHIMYEEWSPASPLKKIIYCYWKLSSRKALHEDFIYRVIADGCTDIFFETKNPKAGFVMGFCNGFKEFNLGRTFNYTGVRFYPSMFTQIFKTDAILLTDRDQELHDILPLVASFFAELNSVTKSEMDKYFLELIKNVDFDVDSRFYDALQLIFESDGDLNLQASLKTGISPRQLRRLFNYYIGAGPKAFAKVIRFQKILRLAPEAAILRKDKVFFSNGFYDQSHFIKDFRKFFGDSPANGLK